MSLEQNDPGTHQQVKPDAGEALYYALHPIEHRLVKLGVIKNTYQTPITPMHSVHRPEETPATIVGLNRANASSEVVANPEIGRALQASLHPLRKELIRLKVISE